MPPSDDRPDSLPPTFRSGALIGAAARDREGRPLGRVVDLVIESQTGRPVRVTGVVVTSGPWGRLLGYESPDERGPWLVSHLARWIIRRHVRTLPWDQVEIVRDEPGDR
jgi:hypothetical protein